MLEPIKNIVLPIAEPIADWFASFNTPEPIVHWGHPLMMGIVVVVMGGTATLLGWQIRTKEAKDVTAQTRKMHKKIALWMMTFMMMGYTGGILSLIMQGQSIFESPHFWTGTGALALLGANGAISMTKFGGNKASLRTAHAYIGSLAILVLVAHAALGLKLGLSI
ncbi:MAG: DUF4079 domain-containing protein [Spirulina sp. SIO3F2]|nr:DUF4079 domain-containing protein [Spirulina sp. SIO3F2]